MANLLTLKSVSKKYPSNDTYSVSDISFSLNQGQILALLGPNGAGKTTIIKIILGLISQTSGQVLINGQPYTQSCKALFGAVLEGSRNVYWRLSAIDNLRYFGTLRGMPK